MWSVTNAPSKGGDRLCLRSMIGAWVGDSTALIQMEVAGGSTNWPLRSWAGFQKSLRGSIQHVSRSMDCSNGWLSASVPIG